MTPVLSLVREPLPTPNQDLVAGLEELAAMARSGLLQSFIGTGFTSDCQRVIHWSDFHIDRCQMLGSLAWLQDLYKERNRV